MKPSLAAEVARLDRMSANQLAIRFEKVFGESSRSRNKRYLLRRIAWRLQANSEGGLSERARKRAEELALDAEIRVTRPRAATVPANPPAPQIVAEHDPRLPPPGSWIERIYKGTEIRVLVVADGFEYEGRRYRSLTMASPVCDRCGYGVDPSLVAWG